MRKKDVHIYCMMKKYKKIIYINIFYISIHIIIIINDIIGAVNLKTGLLHVSLNHKLPTMQDEISYIND